MNFCFLLAILEKSACPTHTLRRLWSFWSTDKFFQILLVGVALGKTPIFTQFLVRQTEFALVWPMPCTQYYNAWPGWMIRSITSVCRYMYRKCSFSTGLLNYLIDWFVAGLWQTADLSRPDSVALRIILFRARQFCFLSSPGAFWKAKRFYSSS